MMNKKQITLGITGFLTFILLSFAISTVGINDGGYRTVIQTPNGTIWVKFSEGWYFDFGGKVTTYTNIITQEFDGDKGQPAIDVRYQDGGTGQVFGVARISLPNSEAAMLKVHREFLGVEGIREKIFKPTLEEAMVLTAGLMTSEEAYAEKRNDFANWAKEQFKKGKYVTKLERKTVIVEPEELDVAGKVIKKAVTRKKNVPIIDMSTGMAQHMPSDLAYYSIGVSGFVVNDWDFETKTLTQIDTKRAAEMAIITSRADTAKAKQRKLQAEAEGETDVATAKYAQEVIKAEQVVIAEREQEVAVINAEREVLVNKQNYLAQVEDVKAAKEEAKAITARTTAQAAAKKRLIEADGALAVKLAAYVEVNSTYAKEFGKRKWVPEFVMGSSSTGGVSTNGTGATDLIQLLTAKTAKDIQLDLTMRAGSSE